VRRSLARRRSRIIFAVAFAAVMTGVPANAHDSKQFTGPAAYYSMDYKGLTASGARYDPDKYTCAHRWLPFGTRLRVTDRRTGRSVVVTVNDRGPFTKGRVLDLSLAAAKALNMFARGVIQVTATVQ
jgi:rare lipoprotein A